MKRNPAGSRQRRGFVLIEALLYHILIVALMVAALQTLKLLRLSERSCEQNALFQREVRRFADDFRNDVRIGTVTSLSSDTLELSMPSGEIRYRILPDGIERTAETSPVQRERYLLSNTYRATFDDEGDSTVSSVIRSVESGERPVFEIHALQESK